jgi:hypothetical protein
MVEEISVDQTNSLIAAPDPEGTEHHVCKQVIVKLIFLRKKFSSITF